jgi:hypothetical protein
MSINWLEWFGYAASVVILISLTMSSIVKLRWINLAGAIMFAAYGYLIGSIPTGTLNLGIAFIDIYYLARLYRAKDDLSIVAVEPDSPFVLHFWKVNGKEIAAIFGIAQPLLDAETFLYLRNNSVAGILAGRREGELFMIKVDYVVPTYRDLKIGEYFLQESRISEVLPGVRTLEITVTDETHEAYLRHVGFRKSSDDPRSYTKRIIG